MYSEIGLVSLIFIQYQVVVRALKTIEDARKACTTEFGEDWSVKQEGSGALICTKGNTSQSLDCNTIDTWRLVVWKNGSPVPWYSEISYSTFAGCFYGGHKPCNKGDNLGTGYCYGEKTCPQCSSIPSTTGTSPG